MIDFLIIKVEVLSSISGNINDDKRKYCSDYSDRLTNKVRLRQRLWNCNDFNCTAYTQQLDIIMTCETTESWRKS